MKNISLSPFFKYLILLVLQILIVQFLGLFPEIITDYYFEALYPFIAKILHFTLGWIPFSLGDILYTILFLSILYTIFKLIQKKGKNWKIILKKSLIFINVFYLIFQLFWGLNYKKLDFSTQFQLKKYTAGKEELYELTSLMIQKTNYLRTLQQEDSQGITQFSYTDIKEKSYNAYQTFTPTLNLQFQTKAPVYQSLFSDIIAHLGIGGYYNPFVGSAQINAKSFPIDYAWVINHEIAHQYGFASEKEANYVSFLVNMKSGKTDMQYSACYNTLFHLLFEVYKIDPEQAKLFKSQLSEDVLRDRMAERKYYEQYQGKMNDAFSQANNLYLKANGEAGIESYSYYTQLLLNQYLAERNKEAKFYILE